MNNLIISYSYEIGYRKVVKIIKLEIEENVISTLYMIV